MKLIDLSISNAFRRMKAIFKTNANISRKVYLSEAHVGRILSGKTTFFSDETWDRIKPIISPYLTAEEDDFIRKRIAAIYAGLDRAEQAELLAAAERIKARSSHEELPRQEVPALPDIEVKVEQDPPVPPPNFPGRRIVPDPINNSTLTPKGKNFGGVLDIEVRCPECGGLLHIPKINAGKTHACPNCGKHIKLKN